MKNLIKSNTYIISLVAMLALSAGLAHAAANETVRALAKKEQPALIDTLKELVAFESGSRELEELDKIANVIANRLKALGGKVELIEASEADTVRLSDTPDKLGKMVKATFTGSGSKKILLMAHMDTVYPKGMAARQPFRIDGDRAYGLGIADNRHGLAVILHTLAMLRAMNFRDYGTITVFINADEEIGSPGSRHHHTRLGAEHDAVMSFEGGGNEKSDRVRLATSGHALALLTVRGRASHAQTVYGEIGKKLDVLDDSASGFTDAANASLKTKAPVIEGFGLHGFGAHTTNAEYIVISSIEPRLYLAAHDHGHRYGKSAAAIAAASSGVRPCTPRWYTPLSVMT